jgi:hypothetical protein
LDGLFDAAFERDELSSSLQFPEIDGKVPAKVATGSSGTIGRLRTFNKKSAQQRNEYVGCGDPNRLARFPRTEASE